MRECMAATIEHDIDTLVAEMHARMSSDQAGSTGCAYARYSTDFQHSIIDQLRGVFGHAIQLGIFIPRAFVFYDTAITGKKSNRRGLNAVKDVLAKKSAKTLLVFTTNRLYRKSYNCSKFIEEEVVEPGLRCVFVRSGIDTGLDDKWRLPLQIQGLVDELGTSQYAPNIRAAHEGLFVQRLVVTTLPYGYMGEDIPGPLTKRHLTRQIIVIDPEIAHWVKKIFHWFVVEGRILARILEELNDKVVPPGPKSDGTFWTPQALHYLLTNSCYRGHWVYGKGESVWQSKKDYSKRVLRPKPLCEAHFEILRLVSDEIWFKAQEILASSPQRNAGRKPKDGDQTTRPRILNGLLLCQVHQSPLKVGGAYGRWMFCPKCYALPKAKRPLYNYLRRDLTLRGICRAMADAIRADDTLVSDLIAPSLTAAAGWIFANKKPLAETFDRIGGAVVGSLTGGTQRLDRIGGTLVALDRNQREVIGLLHRHEDKLDGMGRAVDGLAAGQAGLGESLGLLTSLSAVTLGFSVLTPVLLLAQFRALNRRLDSLSREIKAIQERLDLWNAAELRAGLTFLTQACDDDSERDGLLHSAYTELTKAELYYSAFLESELSKGGSSNRDFLWLLSRHQMMAVLGLAACHLRRKDPRAAEATLHKGMETMRLHATAVFQRTIGPDPMRYLMPAMREHGATLEAMAELYRQAGHAGILADASESASDFFEGQRVRLASAADPLFYKGRTVTRLRAELAEATAAVEEVNRVQGL